MANSQAMSPRDGDRVLSLLASAELDDGLEDKVPPRGGPNNFYKHAQWTPDGTSIIANSSDNIVRTYVVPVDLLDNDNGPQHLRPFSSFTAPSAIDVVTPVPYFDLANPSAAMVLSASNDQPIRLNSATVPGYIAGTYPWITETTEQYIKPASMTFQPSSQGSVFFVGARGRIATFDLSRPGDGPASVLKTNPKNRGGRDSVWGLPGIVATMAVQGSSDDALLAAGTLDRWVGLYDAQGAGSCVSAFSVAGLEDTVGFEGHGVTKVAWSGCGRYLYAGERRSDGMFVYDIRMMNELLAWTTRRNANTQQRMDFTLAHDGRNDTSELWAGGMDGHVRCWSATEKGTKKMLPDVDIDLEADVVHSIDIHAEAPVLMTSSGTRHLDGVYSETAKPSCISKIQLWHMQNTNDED